jgi:hypothetical protein
MKPRRLTDEERMRAIDRLDNIEDLLNEDDPDYAKIALRCWGLMTVLRKPDVEMEEALKKQREYAIARAKAEEHEMRATA